MTNYKCQNEMTRNQTLHAVLLTVTTCSLQCNANIITGPWSSAGSPHRLGWGPGLMRIIQRKQGSCCPSPACCPHRCLGLGSGKTPSVLVHVPMTHLGAVRFWSFHPLGVLVDVDNRKVEIRYPLSSDNTLYNIYVKV